jgi:hypothetical protein
MAVKHVSDFNGWTQNESVREEISQENFWIWERGIDRRLKIYSVVNDKICNRIKGYEMCVGRVARSVKKGRPTRFWWRNVK